MACTCEFLSMVSAATVTQRPSQATSALRDCGEGTAAAISLWGWPLSLWQGEEGQQEKRWSAEGPRRCGGVRPFAGRRRRRSLRRGSSFVDLDLFFGALFFLAFFDL